MPCSECETYVLPRELNYSVKHYGKVLCRDCQQGLVSREKTYAKKKERSTPEAIKLCEALVKMGFNAHLEKYDGYKHIDIAIPEHKINIEVDGMQHQYNKNQALSDLKRTYYSFKKGYVTLRIPNKLMQEDPYETARYIKGFIQASATAKDDRYF